MAKIKQSFQFKGELEIDGGEIYVIETTKDETKSYNLSTIINSLVGSDRVINVSLSEDNEAIPSE